MPKNKMISVLIKKVRDPNGKESLRATVPMNFLFEKDFDTKWFDEELTKFEARYFDLINRLKNILQSIRSIKQKNGKVLLYWEFGNKIMGFMEQSKNNLLFLMVS